MIEKINLIMRKPKREGAQALLLFVLVLICTGTSTDIDNIGTDDGEDVAL